LRYHTSFYIHIDNYAKLSKAVTMTGTTMSELIIQMMYNYAKDHKKMQIEQGVVQFRQIWLHNPRQQQCDSFHPKRGRSRRRSSGIRRTASAGL